MKRIISFLRFPVIGLMILWIALTIFVQLKGEKKLSVFGEGYHGQNAMIIYDPDPIYNLDEKLANQLAKGISSQEWKVTVATVAALAYDEKYVQDLYIIIANTYNWAPDRATTRMIDQLDLKGQRVIAITLGSGSTNRAQRLLEEQIRANEAILVDSKAYWLLRPNDEHKMNESNVEVAEQMAFELGKRIVLSLD